MKKLFEFSYSKNMANFEVFHQTILSSINLLFLKSEPVIEEGIENFSKMELQTYIITAVNVVTLGRERSKLSKNSLSGLCMPIGHLSTLPYSSRSNRNKIRYLQDKIKYKRVLRSFLEKYIFLIILNGDRNFFTM